MVNTIAPRNIILFGANGSGKTTLGRIISAGLSWSPHFVDMSRACKVASAFDPDFANIFASHSAKGELVPNESMMPRFATYMKTYGLKDQFVFSGIFREASQVEYAYQQIHQFQHSRIPLQVLRIKLHPDEAVRRCRLRAEEAIKHGQAARSTDLSDDVNRERVKLYEDEVQAVLTTLGNCHGKYEVVEVESQVQIQETMAIALSALGIRDAFTYRFPDPTVTEAEE